MLKRLILDKLKFPLKPIAGLTVYCTVIKEPTKSLLHGPRAEQLSIPRNWKQLWEKPHIPLSKDHIRFESAEQAQR